MYQNDIIPFQWSRFWDVLLPTEQNTLKRTNNPHITKPWLSALTTIHLEIATPPTLDTLPPLSNGLHQQLLDSLSRSSSLRFPSPPRSAPTSSNSRSRSVLPVIHASLHVTIAMIYFGSDPVASYSVASWDLICFIITLNFDFFFWGFWPFLGPYVLFCFDCLHPITTLKPERVKKSPF